jgi:hypothetical protein
VTIPISGALISGTKRPHRTTATPTTGHGTGATTIQSGSVAAIIPKLASLSGAKRSRSLSTSIDPTMAPMPNPVKIHAATCGLRSYRVYASRGTATLIPFAAPSRTMIVSEIGPRSGSRAR